MPNLSNSFLFCSKSVQHRSQKIHPQYQTQKVLWLLEEFVSFHKLRERYILYSEELGDSKRFQIVGKTEYIIHK